jgi:hypothetical protein
MPLFTHFGDPFSFNHVMSVCVDDVSVLPLLVSGPPRGQSFKRRKTKIPPVATRSYRQKQTRSRCLVHALNNAVGRMVLSYAQATSSQAALRVQARRWNAEWEYPLNKDKQGLSKGPFRVNMLCHALAIGGEFQLRKIRKRRK